MKIKIIFIGKTDNLHIDALCDYYYAKLKHYCTAEIVVLKELSKNKTLPLNALKKAQAAQVLALLQPTDYLVLLDEKGKQFTSEGLAKYFDHKQQANVQSLVFLVGGAFGFDAALYERAQEKIALSLLTFSHQMVRIFWLEQIYRAFSILKGEKYHHV